MMTTEELDALDALLREQDKAAREANEAYRNSWPHSGGDDFLAKQDAIHTTLVRSRNADAAVRDASGSNFKTLLAAAREAATLRVKLIESETWRTELRTEMDAVKGKLRDVTGQLNEALADAAERRAIAADNAALTQSFGKRLEAKRAEAEVLKTERDALKAQRDAAQTKLAEVLDEIRRNAR